MVKLNVAGGYQRRFDRVQLIAGFFWRFGVLSGLLLTSSGAAAAGEKIYFHEEDYDAHTLAAFNRAVSALPMDPRDGDQVRVWFEDVMGGNVTGYIVTRKGVWRCKLRYANDNGKYIVVHRGNCSGPRYFSDRVERVMALLGDAARLENEKPRSCPVMDGWQADVEGIFEGKRFAFEAANSNECADTNPVAARTNTFLRTVSAAFYSKEQ